MIRNKHIWTGLALAFVVLVSAILVFGQAGAAANAPYYDNQSGVVSSSSPSNATLHNITKAAVSLAPSLIGTGAQDPSATGFQGFLLTGLVFGGTALMGMAGAGLGAIGGSILGLFVSYGFVDLGYAPAWLKPLLLIGVGTLAFVMFRRVLDR